MFSLGFGYVFLEKWCFTSAPHTRRHAADPSFWRPWRPGAARKTLFVLHLAFEWFFLAFWTSKGPSRTTKNHENHVTVIKKQGFAIFEKIRFQGRFYCPWGTLWASFWSPLRSLGLLLAPFGPPKRVKSRNTKRKNDVLNRPRRPDGPKGRQRSPRTSKMDTKS